MIVAFCVLIAASIAFWLVLDRQQLKAQQVFELDYLNFLSLLISEMRSGQGFNEALLSVRQYLRSNSVLVREIVNFNFRLTEGTSSVAALRAFCRNCHPDVILFRVAVMLTIEQGAAIVPCLIRLKNYTKQRQIFRSRLRSAVAAQKLSTIGIIFAMFFVLTTQVLGGAKDFQIILQSSLGQVILIVAFSLIAIGVCWMFWMCRFKLEK